MLKDEEVDAELLRCAENTMEDEVLQHSRARPEDGMVITKRWDGKPIKPVTNTHVGTDGRHTP